MNRNQELDELITRLQIKRADLAITLVDAIFAREIDLINEIKITRKRITNIITKIWARWGFLQPA